MKLISASICFLLLFFCQPAAAARYYVNGSLSAVPVAASPGNTIHSLTDYSASYERFSDYPRGYQMLVPKGSRVDISLSAFCTVFTSPGLTVEVYYDDLTNNSASFSDYVFYSNSFLYKGGLHAVTADYAMGGGHTTRWQRAKLARVENDKNYYQATAIRRTSQKIYTIILKSSEPIGSRGDTITGSFSFISPQGIARNFKENKPSTTTMNQATRSAFDELFGKNATLTWGLFEYSAPQVFHQLEEKEKALDYRFKVLLRYQTMDEPLPLRQLEKAAENDRIVELTMATIHKTNANALWASSTASAAVSYKILNGDYDEYLKKYAQDLKAFGKPVLFRLNNEMNGDWCWYSAFYTARDTSIYKELWRYIRAVFDAEGVDNLIWVWNPHDVSLPDFAWNNAMAYYPGDEYVDVVGLTGYNNGTYFSGEKWRTFNEIYAPLYHDYLALFDKPFMITEFSSNSVGGDKAAWINDMFKDIGNYPNIKVAVWWHGVDYDKNGNPGRVYLIDDSPEVTLAMKEGLKNYPSKVKFIPPVEPEVGPILRRPR